MMASYVIITPAYNEELNISHTIKSVIKQSILPIEWIIINDGSTDGTKLIVEYYINKYPWIKLLNVKKQKLDFGAHAVGLFYIGYKELSIKDFDFIVKLDADLDIDRSDFFEYQIRQFEKNTKLGISSGITYTIEKGYKNFTKGRPYWHTGGAMKMYRKKCFDDIGGIKRIYGWDGLDEYQAMYRSWKTRTFFDLHVNHLGKPRAQNREKQLWLVKKKGTSLYLRGYPLEFIVSKFLIYLFKNPKKGFAFIRAYLSLVNSKTNRLVTKDEMRVYRRLQYIRIFDKLIRKELL